MFVALSVMSTSLLNVYTFCKINFYKTHYKIPHHLLIFSSRKFVHFSLKHFTGCLNIHPPGITMQFILDGDLNSTLQDKHRQDYCQSVANTRLVQPCKCHHLLLYDIICFCMTSFTDVCSSCCKTY